MTLDELIKYCLGEPAAEETYPWGDGELVCKVGGKAFAFIGLGSGTIGELVDLSYDGVVARLPKAKRP